MSYFKHHVNNLKSNRYKPRVVLAELEEMSAKSQSPEKYPSARESN